MSPEAAENQTILVNGMSRSGTTLLVTLLDAHPDIAMCYDVVPGELSLGLDEAITQFKAQIASIGQERLSDINNLEDINRLRAALSDCNLDKLAWTLVACRRSGITPVEFAASMEECRTEGLARLKTPEDRLLVARKLLSLKKGKEQRAFSGLKLLMPPDQPNRVFEKPCFITIVRDPRDVVASHVNLKWDSKISNMAKRWNGFTARFIEMAESETYRSMLIRFEDLVLHPSETAKNITEFVGLPHFDFTSEFARRAAVFDIKDAFSDKYQLFWKEGLSKSKVGSWRSIISQRDADLVSKVCDKHMSLLQYDNLDDTYLGVRQ